MGIKSYSKLVHESVDELAALAPFTRDYPIPERGARYYLCRSGTCARPVDSIAELKTLLPIDTKKTGLDSNR